MYATLCIKSAQKKKAIFQLLSLWCQVLLKSDFFSAFYKCSYALVDIFLAVCCGHLRTDTSFVLGDDGIEEARDVNAFL